MIARSSIGWRACLILAMVAGLSESSLAGFTIQDLGVIVPTGTSGAQAINAKGQAAGFVTNASGTEVAAKGAGGGGFQPASLPSGAVSSIANSINLLGNIAGTYLDANGLSHGFFAGSGGTTTLSPLMVNGVSGTFTVANGINGSNQVVGTGDIPGGATRAFIGGAGGTTIIQPLGGSGSSNQGNGINDSGVVVGTSGTANGPLHAFLATSTGPAMDLLNRNPAGDFSYNTYGMAIANNGNVAGYGDVGQYEHAFFGSGGGGALVDLGVLPGATSSKAYGVNDLSQVVGELDYGLSMPGQYNSRAFLWNPTNGMVDLNTLLSSSDQANWILTDATGINDAGQISGEGYFDGVLHGFILTPTGAVPEPPTFVLSVMGFGIVAAWSRLRRGRTGVRAAA